MRKLFIITVLLLAAASYSAMSGENIKKVKLYLIWTPQCEFAGFYAAKENGIYRKYGLDVEILPRYSLKSPSKMLNSSEADFSILWLSTALLEREKGTPVVNLCQIICNSSLIAIANKRAGIHSMQDLNGKRIGIYKDDPVEIQKLIFKKNNIEPLYVPISSSIYPYLKGGILAISATSYNEYYKLISSGVDSSDMTIFSFKDYLYNIPEDGIYCLDDTYNKDPELCRKMVQASLEGWRWSFANQDSAVSIVLKEMLKYNIQANRMHQSWMLAKIKELSCKIANNVDQHFLSKKEYDGLIEFLKQNGILKSFPKYEDFIK